MAASLRQLLIDIVTATIGQQNAQTAMIAEVNATFDQLDTDVSDVDTDVG